MSERAQPNHCPYCGDEDLRPDETDPDNTAGWECRACLRLFTLRFRGMTPRPEEVTR